MEILLVIVIILLIINTYFTLNNSRNRIQKGSTANIGNSILQIQQGVGDIDKSVDKLEKAFRDEISRNREESRKGEKEARIELSIQVQRLSEAILGRMSEIANFQKNQLDTYSNTIEKSLKSFENQFSKSVNEFNNLQKEKFNDLSQKQGELLKSTEDKLEKMRETVDEKLQSTLEKRLGESFKLVSERLEVVHKGLGEMQTLAMGVGDLKKVLSNVKTRGTLGEIQLGRILDQILTKDQYDINVATKKGSRDNVEFAIRLPGKDKASDVVYLPVDSKFPLDVYHNLVDAYDTGDQSLIEEGYKKLEAAIKKSAKDIRDKYIDPPYTTDFAIMFLPIEGLYAEVVKRTNLVEILQREYKINITGPTTLAALLNSLQMGFRTLAIEKRSSEVWNVLGAVKTEFGKFEEVLKSTQKKLNQASTDLDKLVGTRTKQINKKLMSVESLTNDVSEKYIDVFPIEE
ncbi:DNA recombination protein RmuC [Clostridium subterminale]|uniref:DNA recombination protein RmuC n=1 Tax=Clostridium subterminale TaxID=1550 RepID=A0ABN1KSS4_CLOSU